MPNGSQMGGNVSSTQSSIIIPRPGHPDLLHVFLVNLPLNLSAYNNGLTHAVVDINQNNGSGAVILRDDTLLNRVSEKITATFHRNGRIVRIITHLWDSDAFYTYKVTDQGLTDLPILSHAGSVHTYSGFNINQAVGQMKLNPEGNKLALAIYEQGIIELFDFNNETGIINNAITSAAAFNYAYGIEFSADGKYLYVTTTNTDFDTNLVSYLYQFALEDEQDLFNKGVLIASETGGNYYAALQLATDGKIYVSRGNDYLGVIHNPTRPGLECNLDQIDNVSNEGLYLQGKGSLFGLPNFNQSYFLIPKFLYHPNCFGEETVFEIVNTTNVDSVHWYFGDGSGSTALSPVHTYASPGNFTVRLTDYFNGKAYSDSLLININALPDLRINGGQDTMLLLLNSSVMLDAGSGYQTYLWNDGSTGQTLEAFEEGYYWVDVLDYNCCSNRDTIFVQNFYMVIPNAFIPGGTGPDNHFYVLDVNDAVREFTIIIYNRWGQQVFRSDELNFKWDGAGCGTGTYYFTLKAVLSNGYPYQYNGNVTIIR